MMNIHSTVTVFMMAIGGALAFLFMSKFQRGVRNTGVQQNDLLFKNTEDLQLGIENEAGKNNGRIGEVTAPMPVPLPDSC